MARHALVYQQSVRREPWEQDPDAWKRGAASAAVDEPRPGWLARRRQARAEQKAAAQERRDRELDHQVDAVLERVSEVGMSGLTADEKAVLKRASERRRGAG